VWDVLFVDVSTDCSLVGRFFARTVVAALGWDLCTCIGRHGHEHS
jgi:hypothetical protein